MQVLNVYRDWWRRCRQGPWAIGRVLRWKRTGGRWSLKHTWAELGPVLDQLPAGAMELQRSSELIEQRFLLLGTEIERLSNLSDRLVGGSENLIKMAVGQCEGSQVLQIGVAALQKPLAFLDDCQKRSCALVEHLLVHQRRIAEVRAHENLLRSAVAPLKFVQTLFRIECANLSADVQTTFAALSHDIQRLNERVAELFGEQFQGLKMADERISELVIRVGAQVRDQQRLVAEKSAFVDRSIAALQRALASNQTREIHLGQTTRAIRDEVFRLVMAMQVQDITRQKVQHAESGLAEMRDRLVNGTQDSDTLAALHRSARVELGQLNAVDTDLQTAETSMREAVEKVQTLVRGLDEDCLLLRNFESISVSEDGMVQVLLNAIEELRPIVAATASIQTEIHNALQPLANLASNLTGAMRQVSHNIKLIALNAQIQAVQTGAGTGLEVLSRHTCGVSDDVDRLSQLAAVELDALLQGFNALVAECSTLQTLAGHHQRWLDTEARDLEHSLHAHRDKALESFFQVSSLATGLGEKLGLVQDKLDYHDAAVRSMAPARSLLTEVTRLTQAAADNQDPASSQALSDELRRKYTMASERAVHMEALGHAVAPEPITPPNAADGVDWFGGDESAPAVVRAQSTASDGADSGLSVPTPGLETRVATTISQIPLEGAVENGTGNGVLKRPETSAPVAAAVTAATVPPPAPAPTAPSNPTASSNSNGSSAALGDNVELF